MFLEVQQPAANVAIVCQQLNDYSKKFGQIAKHALLVCLIPQAKKYNTFTTSLPWL